MILYIARHGESRGNTGEDNGPDPILSEKGLAQAQLLGERMKKIKLDAVFSSPLTRAVQTAEETARLQQTEVEILPDCYEVENETTDEAYARAKGVIDRLKK